MTLVIEPGTVGVRMPLPRKRVIAIGRWVLRSEGVRDARLAITFVSARRIAALNWRHLGHRGSTDVISFSLAGDLAGAPVTGDIYISPEVARRNAARHEVSVREELTRLIVHGVLHVLGFDHPEGRGRMASPMWQRQESLLRELLPA